jgi:hypothetical protein
MYTFVGEWDPVTAQLVGEEVITGTFHATDLHTHVTTLSAPLDRVGMNGSSTIEFFVVARGLNEDWLFTTKTDVAPDGATMNAGPRYRFDPPTLKRAPGGWSLTIPGGQSESIPVVALGGDYDPTLLALYPDNRFEGPSRQLQVIQPGVVRPPTFTAYVPVAERR